jgi:hypothetical protein
MTSTLSLKTSQKLYELLGECETEKLWARWTDPDGKDSGWYVDWAENVRMMKEGEYDWYPAFSFSELIRLLPRITDTFNIWTEYTLPTISKELLDLYMLAPSEKAGMELVDERLAKHL